MPGGRSAAPPRPRAMTLRPRTVPSLQTPPHTPPIAQYFCGASVCRAHCHPSPSNCFLACHAPTEHAQLYCIASATMDASQFDCNICYSLLLDPCVGKPRPSCVRLLQFGPRRSWPQRFVLWPLMGQAPRFTASVRFTVQVCNIPSPDAALLGARSPRVRGDREPWFSHFLSRGRPAFLCRFCDAFAGPCGHDFCRTCLLKWQETQLDRSEELGCPLCREAWPDALPGAFPRHRWRCWLRLYPRLSCQAPCMHVHAISGVAHVCTTACTPMRT